MMFRNRSDAGTQLGDLLAQLDLKAPLVLAIPRGGIVTGAAIAARLGADLDVLLTHKLRSPSNPELAFGAVGEGDEIYIDPDISRQLDITPQEFEAEHRHQLTEIARRRKLFRDDAPPAPMTGRSVILTDDGLATGSTLMAAIPIIRKAAPHELILAVPVAPPDRLKIIGALCDRVVCPIAPPGFQAVGQYYESFNAVSDAEAAELLRKSRRKAP